MSEGTPLPARRRILVAMDTSPLARVAIEMAAQLADQWRGDLEGVFYEDSQLLRLSSLPFIRETSFTARQGRPLDPVAMVRSMQAKADEIRGAMARQCSQRKLSWSLTTVREPAARHASQSARDVDLVVIGIESRQPRVSVHWRETRPVVHPLTVLYTDSTASRRALDVAAEAAQQGWQLLVLPLADTPEEAQRLGREALHAAPQAQLRLAPGGSIQEIVQAVQTLRSELVVCPWSSSILDDASVEELVDKLDCVVMLVR